MKHPTGNPGNTKIFITGSGGLIGSTLYISLKNEGYSVYGVDIVTQVTVDSLLDIASRSSLRKKLEEIRPNIIIHTGAIKSLLTCEEGRVRSWNTNVESTAEIVQYAKAHNTKIIYISSDVVFDGENGNYTETDLPNPINWYGTTKYHSELLLQNIKESVICRTALVIGDLRENDRNILAEELKSETLNNQSLLPYYVLGRLKNNQKVSLPNKVVSSPTYINLLKDAVSIIIKNNLSGIYHCVGSESISRYKFAIKIADFFHLDKKLIQIDESGILSIRPKNLSMNINKTYKILGFRISDWDVESTLNCIKAL